MGEASEADPEPSAPNVLSLNPSALGFTAHVDGQATELHVTAKWARYEFTASEREENLGKRMWRRVRQGGTVPLRLAEGLLGSQAPDPEQPDVVVRGRARKHNGNWLVSLFLENRQSQPDRRRHAPSWVFQVQLSDVPGADTDPDLAELADLELGMQWLAELAETSADSLAAALRPLVTGYRGWIERRTADIDRPGEYLSDYADQACDNLRVATRVADRIETGIDLLAGDPNARRAFGFANQAMYLQRLHT